MRSVEYFIEAILNPTQLVATRCDSWTSYFLNRCNGETVALGNLQTKAMGNFYLETNRDRPYSRAAKSSSSFGLGKVLNVFTP